MDGVQLAKSTFPPEGFPDFDESVEVTVGRDQVVCFVGMMGRTILLDGDPNQVAGIGYVVTHSDYRHLGLMRAAMKAAHHRARVGMGAQWALLNAGHQGLYTPLGYRHPPNLAEEWMVVDLGTRPWPDEATVDLQGTW